MSAIATQDLSKTFRSGTRAVDGVSFSIEAGERVAFIGPNGAGKSTTLKLLSGLLAPTSGTATVAGLVPWAERRKLASRIGLVFGQRGQLWNELSLAEALELQGAIYGVGKAEQATRLDMFERIFGLGAFKTQTVRTLSLGQRMRAEIAASLLHAPGILFLDEPTIGLDVEARADLREHLRALNKADGLTLLLTSHDMDDVESICSRVILINHGRLVFDGPLAELKRDYAKEKRVTLVTEAEHPELALTTPEARILARAPHRITLAVVADGEAVGRTLSHALAQLSVRDVTIEETALEDIVRAIYAKGRAHKAGAS